MWQGVPGVWQVLLAFLLQQEQAQAAPEEMSGLPEGIQAASN